MSRPLKVQIVERVRQLIADEHHWCCRHFGEDANGFPVSPTSTSATKRCALGAVIEPCVHVTAWPPSFPYMRAKVIQGCTGSSSNDPPSWPLRKADMRRSRSKSP